MFFVNYISRNDTDPYFPMFEIIYGVELILIVSTFIIGLLVIYLHYKAAKLQRLVRLRNSFSIFVDILHACSRIVILHHQYFGVSEYVETTSLMVGSMMKEIFFGYMTSLGFIVALDRCAATKLWAWYESEKKSTLLFFSVQEGLLSFAIAYLHLIIIVLRYNIRVMSKLKQGAVINRYSVSQTFQIKENISVLTSYASIAIVQILMTTPAFAFFSAFLIVPSGIGYDELRFFCVAMFDLWLSIASIGVICSLLYYFSRLKKALRSRKGSSVEAIGNIHKNTQEAGDAYFKMLANEWR
ncbi:hypothetical protein PRIPAC_79637 [Pristionchus pacificus]|uniref:G protein-coupled receptor n=1 Tax=Pristionchus pacificus TaxID=54126 RepID=A0A2A6CP46_PRIPA|nr:hypothetical protein PRIPAC_79637 [Pristionchus pacificus]|eukprot:PDM79972.1 G protein-coupled receptor [Pristionchus pacificus]